MTFIESILLRDGTYHNVDLHQQRINKAISATNAKVKALKLEDLLPIHKNPGRYKARLVYGVSNGHVATSLSISPYTPKKIQHLAVVHSSPFDYAHKYEDRSVLNRLAQTATADDIIIVIKGKVTDASYANLAFWDGNKWYTPDSPLLEGVRRRHLIDAGQLHCRQILGTDISSFEKVSLINAMIDLGEIEVPIQQIAL